MDAAAELGRNPASKHQIQPEYEMSRLTRDGTAELVSRGQFFRREQGQGNINFPFSADHEQDWQPYSVDPYSCYMCDHTYIHAYTQTATRFFFLVWNCNIDCFFRGFLCHCRFLFAWRVRRTFLTSGLCFSAL